MLQDRPGALIPAYFAANSANFTTIINQKNAHPDVPVAVVLNPTGSGVGDAAQSAYTTLMNNLTAAGILVLGYVYTNFGEEAEATVQTEMTKWWDFYNAGTTATTRRVNGIYFAAMSNQSSKQTYYSNLHTYARVTKGFQTTAGSTGTTAPTSFLNSTCADSIVVYEGVGVPLPQNYSQYDAFPNNNIGLIPYGIGSINIDWLRQISAYAGWMYMTSDSGINPYDTLPSYFSTIMTELDGMGGGGGGGGAATDNLGIRKIYHTKTAGEEWYMASNPTSDERFQNEPSMTANSDGSYSMQGSSPDYFVRLEGWSPAYSNTQQRIDAKWRNVEITAYVKAEEEMVQGTYLFQLYSRGGHHGSADPCEGSALKSRLWARATSGALQAGFTKELCHSDYTGSPSNQGVVSGAVPWSGSGFYNRWIGIKHIIYNVVESGNTYTKQEQWVDIDVQNSSGNLVINNNWKFLTSFVDRGGWCTSGTSCEPDCPVGQCTILTSPGGNTRSGTANFNRNLAAVRSDGRRFRIMHFTAREIDPAQPVSGGGSTPPPPPPAPPSTEPASSFDAFGVRKVHPTRSGGAEWYLASTPTTDARFNMTNGLSITNNSDGSYKINNTTIAQKFLQVYQRNGYNSGLSATNAQNHGQCAANGYMQDTSDWRNVEMTGYFRVISEMGAGTCEICEYARGGRHVDPQPNCEGSSMKGFLHSSGQTRFAKEQYHVAYNYTTYSNQIGSSIVNRWIGFKVIVYNRNVSGNNVVKQEIYVDNNNDNTWIKVDERSDVGGWGNSGATPCNGITADQQIIWGGPIAAFRLDNVGNVDFKWLSVREIDADAISQEPPPSQPGGSCGS